MLAHEMIFQPGEPERWIVANLFPMLSIDIGMDAQALWQMRRANELTEGVWGNIALLLDEGRPEKEVAGYAARYMLLCRGQTGTKSFGAC